jgi:curli biogenesis system outer membrane secretion channel CsgG/outer membrane protein OmpA-like peptidoglycan-associated protein
MHRTIFQRSLQGFAVMAFLGLLSACGVLPLKPGAASLPKEAPVMSGSSSRNNITPMEPAFSCLAQAYREVNAPVASVTVGDVKDYTGKYSQAEGNAITQGGSLMLYSALGKMGNTVRLQERFDTRIAELELAYADRRQLGDGRLHAVEAGKPQVPWVPYFGGSILRSDYYIVGGITEVNYNIQSRGAELSVSSIGGKARTFTMNVGVDLRIVDSRSLVVVKTVSMQKQITGTEVGAGIFRFFGTDLLDMNVGSKNQEPLQLGVRTTIEHGLLELLAAISGLNPQPCVDLSLQGVSTPEKMREAVVAAAALVPKALVAPGDAKPIDPVVASRLESMLKAGPADMSSVPVNAAQLNGQGGMNGNFSIVFEPNKSVLDGVALQMLKEVGVSLAADPSKTLKVDLLTRETENLPSAQRSQLAQERVKAVADALVAAGMARSRIAVEWLPDASSPIQRQGAGMQVVARLKVAEAKAGGGL